MELRLAENDEQMGAAEQHARFGLKKSAKAGTMIDSVR